MSLQALHQLAHDWKFTNYVSHCFHHYNYAVTEYTADKVRLELLQHGGPTTSKNDWVEVTVKHGAIYADDAHQGLNKYAWRGKDARHAVEFIHTNAGTGYLEEKWQACQMGLSLESFNCHAFAYCIVDWWREYVVNDGEEDAYAPEHLGELWGTLTDILLDAKNPEVYDSHEFFGVEAKLHAVLYDFDPYLFEDGMSWGHVYQHKGHAHVAHVARQTYEQRKGTTL